jgi:hypothetical protein
MSFEENRVLYIKVFFWQNDQYKKKNRLAKSNLSCQPKEQGGLGILNLEL